MYALMHALAVASLWGIGGVLVLIIAAHVWGWLNKRDPAEFWDRKRMETQEVYEFASYRNRDVTYSDEHEQGFVA